MAPVDCNEQYVHNIIYRSIIFQKSGSLLSISLEAKDKESTWFSLLRFLPSLLLLLHHDQKTNKLLEKKIRMERLVVPYMKLYYKALIPVSMVLPEEISRLSEQKRELQKRSIKRDNLCKRWHCRASRKAQSFH